jgi:hypothetical protein
MQKIVKTSVAALMLTCMAGNAWAQAGCARPEDMNALKAAAIQQRLMVAALSCDAAAAYNNFVKAYQKELQAADRALQSYFRRLNGSSGNEKYHAYKTHLANASSMQSIGNITNYCAEAKTAFETSLANAKTGLVAFVSGQGTPVEDAYKPCEVRTAARGASLPLQNIPEPRMKPGPAVIPAQGASLAPN